MLRLSQEAIAKKIDSLKCVSDPGRSQPLVEPVSAIGWKGNIAVHMRDRPNDVAGARMLAVSTLNGLDSSLYPLCCGLALPFPRPEILDHPEQHARAGIGVGELDMLIRMMADTAAAADEDHADIGDIDHRHAVVPCSARQLENRKAFHSD